MKNTFLLFTLSLFSIFSVGISAEPVSLDKIAAVVNNSIISESQIQRETQRVLKSLAKSQQQVPESIVRKDVIDTLINEELQMQEAQKQKITVDNITLNREIERIAKRQELNVFELYDKVTAEGGDYFEFREKIRRQLAIQRTFMRVIRSRVKISDQEITDFLNSDLNKQTNAIEFNVSHLSIDVPNNANPEQLKIADDKINSIYEDLINGADFATSATEFSNSSTALQGGELGWLSRSNLPTRFMEELLKMNNQSISKPFRTESGFNILKLNDLRGINKLVINEVNSRHILIKTSEIVSDEQALEKISAVRARITNGENFGKVAKAESEDAGSAALNGELGWTQSETYVPEFKQLVDELPEGKLSQPLKTQFGWHIIEVLGRRSVDKTLEQNRKNAEFTLLNRKAKEQEELWINQLRTSAFIDIRDKG